MTKKLIPRFLVSLSICLILLSALFSSQKLLQLVISGVKASADTVTNPTITIDKNHFLDYFTLKGSATYSDSDNTLTLTAAAGGQVGLASMKENFDSTQNWTLTGELNIGILKTIANNNGADGVGFGWVPDNIGNVGGAGNQLGIGNLKGAFGWTADTYLNDYRSNDIYNWSDKKYSTSGYVGTQIINRTSGYLFYGDPIDGATGTSNWAMGGFGFANPKRNNSYTSYNTSSTSSKPKSISSLEDGKFHTYTMSYQSSTKLVTVTFGTLTWSIPFNTIMAAAGSDTSNAISFFISGSTGAQYNLQQFKFTSLTYTTAPIKSSVNVNYIDINGSPISPPVNITGNVGDNYTTNPLSTPPANMHFNNFNSTDTNTIFNATTNIGTGKILKSGTVVNYVYAPNKVKINYIDDTTGTNLWTDTPDYSNPNYTTASKIAYYLGQGYKLVSDNTPTTNLFATDGATYYVHLAHFRTSLKTVTESINYVDNSTKANMTSITPNPYTVSKTFLTINDPVYNTNTYYYQNGNITTAPTLNANGTPSTAGWTEVTQSGGYWIDSSSNQISFSQVSDPTSKGYIIVGTDDPNKTTSSQTQYVTTQLIPTSLTNSTIHVYYDPTKVVSTTYTINRNINYLDGNDHSIVVAKQAQQTATYTTYQVIDTVTGGLLGYDTNGDGIVDSPTVVWLPSSTNSTTNSTTNSPDLTSKDYGQPSQAAVVAFPDVPTLTDSTKITGQPITSSLTDVNVYYNMPGNLIKLPFTGGSGFIWIIVIAIVALLISVGIRIRKKKDK